MMSAPNIWLSAVRRSITRPQSCTATILLTLTMPVSVSTLTSAICTPPTPLFVRSGGWSRSGFLPCAAIGVGPIFAHASFHVSLRAGDAATRTTPSHASSSSGLAFSAGATFSKSISRACTAARRVEDDTPPIVVEPPDPPDTGYCVSPIIRLMVSSGTPSVSAATAMMHVRVPVPRSCVPIFISTLPSE